MTSRFEEQLPVASESALREAQSLREAAEAEADALRSRLSQTENNADHDRALAQTAQKIATQAQQTLETFKTHQTKQDKRMTTLENHALELEHQFGEAQLRLAESAKPEEVAAWQARLVELEAQAAQAQSVLAEASRLESERLALRKQKTEMAQYARERQTLRRKVEELVATLQNVRLG